MSSDEDREVRHFLLIVGFLLQQGSDRVAGFSQLLIRAYQADLLLSILDVKEGVIDVSLRLFAPSVIHRIP